MRLVIREGQCKGIGILSKVSFEGETQEGNSEEKKETKK